MKILQFFIFLLLFHTALLAQQPKKTVAKKDTSNNSKDLSLLLGLDTSSNFFNSFFSSKNDTAFNKKDVIIDFMKQFDESDVEYLGGKVKKYGSPMADSLGLWFNRLQNYNFKGIDKPNAMPILGADKMSFYNGKYYGGEPFEDGAYIQLQYSVTNKNCYRLYKEIKKAFAIFIKDQAFKFSYDNGTSGKILKNNLPVFDYAFFEDKNGLAGTKLFLYIQNPKFPQIFMLNENDKNNISSTIKDTDKPQIWEVRGDNKGEWYQRYNGIFKDGFLVKGSKTFKGYGSFYDGTWYSKNWGNKDWKHCEVIFFPANTKDTVWGAFNDLDMNVFSEDSRYTNTIKTE